MPTISEQEIMERLIRIDERTESIDDQVERLTHVISGNGRPGLVENFAVLDTRVKALEDDRRDARIPRHVTIGLIISIVLAGFGILTGFMQ